MTSDVLFNFTITIVKLQSAVPEMDHKSSSRKFIELMHNDTEHVITNPIQTQCYIHTCYTWTNRLTSLITFDNRHTCHGKNGLPRLVAIRTNFPRNIDLCSYFNTKFGPSWKILTPPLAHTLAMFKVCAWLDRYSHELEDDLWNLCCHYSSNLDL